MKCQTLQNKKLLNIKKELLVYRWLFFLLFSTPFCHLATTQTNSSEAKENGLASFQFQKKLTDLFNLNFNPDEEQATTSLSEAQTAYLLQYQKLIQYITNDNDNTLRSYHSEFNKTTNKIHSNSAHNNYYLTDLYLHKGIVEYSSGNQASAIYSFLKAYNYYSDNQNDSLQVPFIKHHAIFNILLDKLSGYQEKAAHYFGYKGNSTMGFQQLTEYQNRTTPLCGFNLESKIYLAWSKLKFAPQDTTHILFPNSTSPLLQFITTNTYLKKRQTCFANQSIQQITEDNFNKLPILYYLKGKSLLLDHPQKAEESLKTFLSTYKGNTYKTDALKQIAWIKLLQNDTIAYDDIVSQLINKQPTGGYLDRQAYRELCELHPPHPTLLRGRLLFDYGFFTKADSLLKANGWLATTKWRIEYYYRYGRVLQNQSRSIAAIKCFQKVIDSSIEPGNRYFKPYSAIYIGDYYLSKSDTVKALSAYRLANKFNSNNKEYKEAIKTRVQKSITELRTE